MSAPTTLSDADLLRALAGRGLPDDFNDDRLLTYGNRTIVFR